MQVSLSAIDGNLREAAIRMCARQGLDPDAWLTRKQTADMLGLSPKTLAKWASVGSTLPYQSFFGRARYRAIDAAMWFLTQRRDPSESGAAKAVQMRRARGDRLGRPPRAASQLPVAA